MTGQKQLLKLLILILAALFLLASGCDCDEEDDDDENGSSTDDDDDDDDDNDDDNDDNNDDDECDEQTHDSKIIAGKEYLSDRDPEAAYIEFSEALEACPVSADARVGIVISDALWLTVWFQDALEMPPFQTDDIGLELQQIFEQDLLPVTEEMFELTEFLLENHPNVRFYVDSLPFWLDGDHVTLELRGEWDIYDIANAKAYARAWESAGRLLLAFDLEYDTQLFEDNPLPDDSDLRETIHHYCDLLLQMFDDPAYDSFLTLLENGTWSLSEFAIQAGRAMFEVKDNFYEMRNEIDPQEDDIAGYVDTNGNGQWDSDEPFRAPYFGPLSTEMNVTFIDLLGLFEALGIAFLDTGPEDIYPGVPNWFMLDELNFILEYTDVLDPNNPIRLPPIPIPIGPFFYRVGPERYRILAEILVNIFYFATVPVD